MKDVANGRRATGVGYDLSDLPAAGAHFEQNASNTNVSCYWGESLPARAWEG